MHEPSTHDGASPLLSGDDPRAAAPSPGSRPIQDSPHPVEDRVRRLWWGVLYAVFFRPSPRNLHRWRNWLLRRFGARLHPTARVYPRARIWAPWKLEMGPRSCIGDDVDCYNVAGVTIGANSTVSQYSYLCGATHDFEAVAHPLVPLPINIGSSVWVAADVFVGPGATIADGVVVGARSSVFGDLPAWTVCVGSPARPVRPRVLRDAPTGPVAG